MFDGHLTGNIGRDPELKYLDNGQVVANFTLAVRQNKRNGVAPPARWVDVAVWGKPAEYVGNYVKKGDAVLLVGRVEAPEIYTNRQGEVAVAERFTAANIEKWSEGAPAPAPAPAPRWAPAVDDNDPPF